jgi:hypothetical protein
MMATSGSARGGRLGLSKLMKDGFVRGALSEGTMLYLAAFNIVEVARKFMCKKSVPVFQNNEWDDSINDYVITIDSSRKMRIVKSMDEFNNEPELKEAFRLIIEDVKKHPVFTEGGKQNKLVCKLDVTQLQFQLWWMVRLISRSIQITAEQKLWGCFMVQEVQIRIDNICPSYYL